MNGCNSSTLPASVSPYSQITGGDPHHPNELMTKQQAISALILAEVAKGSTIQEAFDAVLGAGSYKRLAGEVWEAFRAQA